MRVAVLEAGQPDAPQPVTGQRDRLLASTSPLRTGPIITLPSTVFHGNSASAWNMKLTPVGDAAHLAAADPHRARARRGPGPTPCPRVVDLPQPVGPTIAQNWPGSTVNVTSRRAVNGGARGRQEPLGQSGDLDVGRCDTAAIARGRGVGIRHTRPI